MEMFKSNDNLQLTHICAPAGPHHQWCNRDRNLRDETETWLKPRDRDRDFSIKAETETWKFETETETRDLTFLWW